MTVIPSQTKVLFIDKVIDFLKRVDYSRTIIHELIIGDGHDFLIFDRWDIFQNWIVIRLSALAPTEMIKLEKAIKRTIADARMAPIKAPVPVMDFSPKIMLSVDPKVAPAVIPRI